MTQNRYKLNKKYRRLKELTEAERNVDVTGLAEEEEDSKEDEALAVAKVGQFIV